MKFFLVQGLKSNLSYPCLFLFLVLFSPLANSQSFKYDLNAALEKSVQSSHDVKIQTLVLEQADKNSRISKASRLPNLTGAFNNGAISGRSVNPYTNQYTTNSYTVGYYSLNSNTTLFSGGLLNRTIQLDNINVELNQLTLLEKQQIIKSELVKAYMDLCLNKELLGVHREKLRLMDDEYQRVTLLTDAGNLTMTALYELDIEKKKTLSDLNNIQSELDISIHKLNYMLNEDSLTPEDFSMVDDLLITENAMVSSSNEIRYRIASRKVDYMKINYKTVNAMRYPTVSLHLALLSGYSSNYKRLDPATNLMVDYPYNNQVKDNMSQQAIVNIDIPIFSKFKNSLSYQKAKIAYNIAKLEQEKAKELSDQTIEIEKREIQKAMDNVALTKDTQEQSLKLFENFKSRFDAGRLSPFEYFYRQNEHYDNVESYTVAKYNYYLLVQQFNVLHE